MKFLPLNSHHLSNFSTERISHKAMLKPTETRADEPIFTQKGFHELKNRQNKKTASKKKGFD